MRAINVERLVDIKELSAATGLTVGFINKAKREYSLPFYKLGKSVRYKVSEVLKWVEERKKVS